MGMKETSRSISVYFVIVGIVGLIIDLAQIVHFSLNTIGFFLVLPGIGFSIAFLYFGFRLKSLLPVFSQRIIRFLLANCIYEVIVSTISVVAGSGTIIIPIFALLITLYLIKNVRRLSTEMGAETKAQEEIKK